MSPTRSPQEIFGHHAQALGDEDLDAIVITPSGVQRGKDGVRQTFVKLLGDLPQATWDIKTTIYGDDVMLLEWAPREVATESRTASTRSFSATA